MRELRDKNPEIFLNTLRAHGYEDPRDLPPGGIVGLVNVVGSLPTETIRDRLSLRELAFGIYDTGRIAIRLARPVPFTEIFLCKGRLGLWTVPEELHLTIEKSRRPK